MEDGKTNKFCREFILIMQASLDGEAPPEEEKALRSHMEHCESCRTLYGELAAIREATASVAAEPPADLKERILHRLQEENRALSIERIRKSKARKRIIGFTLGAAALLVLAFVGIDRLGFLRIGADSFKAAPNAADRMEYMPEEDAEYFPASEAHSEEAFMPDNYAVTATSEAEPEAEMESGVDYNSSTIAEKVGEIVRTAGIKGLFGEVIYVTVSELPDAEPMARSGDGSCAVYEVTDFAEFITSRKVVVSSVQYELNEKEIRACGLSCGGERILLILDKGAS